MSGAYKYRPQYTQNTIGANVSEKREYRPDVGDDFDTTIQLTKYRERLAADAAYTSELAKKNIENSFASSPNEFRIGETSFEALFDRVLVLVDVFKSGYECARCGGSQRVACTDCVGGKSALNPMMTCKVCQGTMLVLCPDCAGKGVNKGGLVVPDVAQNPPQAGTIVSVGEDVGMGVHRLFGAVRVEARPKTVAPLKIGDRVMFGRFAGHDMTISTTDGKDIPLRLLNESEVLCRMQGTLELRKIGKSTKEELL